MEENFRNIYKAIQEADALLIGASNGLSISELIILTSFRPL